MTLPTPLQGEPEVPNDEIPDPSGLVQKLRGFDASRLFQSIELVGEEPPSFEIYPFS